LIVREARQKLRRVVVIGGKGEHAARVCNERPRTVRPVHGDELIDILQHRPYADARSRGAVITNSNGTDDMIDGTM
jgi:hypothetical protein